MKRLELTAENARYNDSKPPPEDCEIHLTLAPGMAQALREFSGAALGSHTQSLNGVFHAIWTQLQDKTKCPNFGTDVTKFFRVHRDGTAVEWNDL